MFRSKRFVVRLVVYSTLALCAGVVWHMYLAAPSTTEWPPGSFGVSDDGVDIYTVRPQDLRLYWKNASGSPYGSAKNLHLDLKRQGLNLRFALNSGIFRQASEGVTPLGLHVENHKELVPLNAATSGYGNFYLQPNGVFWWDEALAGIYTTQDYAKARRHPAFALQSGPMLVVDGKINPAFGRFSQNRFLRAGVGIRKDGNVLLAISEVPVRFFDFACVFQQRGCEAALYLDGAIISMYATAPEIDVTRGDMAGILTVVGPSN